MFRAAAVVLGIVLSGWSAATAAAPCAGFLDVEDTSQFCANVEWMKNRGVTVGCTTTLYCPNDPVNRLAMAAFISRLDRVLGPTVVDAQDKALGALVTFTATVGQAYYRVGGNGYSLFLLNASAASPPSYVLSNDFVFHAQPNCAGATYMDTTVLVTIIGKPGFVVRGPAGARLLYTAPTYPAPPVSVPVESYLHDGVCTNQAQTLDGYAVTLVEDLSATYTEPFTVN